MPFGRGSGNVTSNDMFEAEVNKGSVNMRSFTSYLNERWRAGWYPLHVFEQDGNTVVIWARAGVPLQSGLMAQPPM